MRASDLKPHLRACGYSAPLLKERFRFGEGQEVPLVAFAERPADARSACIAVLEPSDGPASAVRECRQTGAPIVFACSTTGIEQWKQKAAEPEKVKSINAAEIEKFFAENHDDLGPSRVYKAKTRGLFDKDYQLDFVDIGLMPMVENEIGERLTRLIERGVRNLKRALDLEKVTGKQGHWLLQTAFWLVAAKILRDKQVPGFSETLPTDVSLLFTRLAEHYGAPRPLTIHNRHQHDALQEVAAAIDEHASLAHATTEALAQVYESTVISRETRSELGTHSTPAYIADYLVWQLVEWIEELPLSNRHVFEPACGAAVFLVSAMRAMRELLPDRYRQPSQRHRYFQTRLHGVDVDPFALEIARLSLTLADIPNPNGWDLQQGDVFRGQALEDCASQCTVLLANPPFENFSTSERKGYSGLQQNNKAAEVLARTLPRLRPGAVFGLVVPQSLLHNRAALSLRRLIAEEFELQEICLLPDKVFKFSDAESALLLGRRLARKRTKQVSVRYRRVRERDFDNFKRAYAATTDRVVEQERFATDPKHNMALPDLEEVWRWCEGGGFLADLAEVGKGLEHRGQDLAPGVRTIASEFFEGAVPGFARFETGLMTHCMPHESYINVEPQAIRRPGNGTATGIPQVLINYAPVSRGPWRLKAVIDREGHAVTSRFITVRPRSEGLPLEFLWALWNSPFANAYVYAHSMKRDILVGLVREIPVPPLTKCGIETVSTAAQRYLDAVLSAEEVLAEQRDNARIRDLLLRLDAEVLRLYGLPPRYERQLLDLFNAWERPGVPIKFNRYFADDFEPCISLHEYLSEDYQRSTAGALRDRYEPARDPTLLRALRRASEDFTE